MQQSLKDILSGSEEKKIGKKFNRFLRLLGPGLITGAADDDPSGIATYSQTGAQFGLGQLWTALYMLPFMAGIQEACARIGLVNGKGLAAIVRDNYSKKILVPVILLIIIANTINLGADIGAVAAAMNLILPFHFVVWILLFTAIILILEIFTTYYIYSRILKWLAFALLSYPLTLLILHVPWFSVLKASIIPHIEFTRSFLFLITGVFGTTISPYMFFWECSQEVEEEKEHHLIGRNGVPRTNWKRITDMRLDNLVGMIISECATWSIILVTGITLHIHGMTNITTSSDAAKALEPLVRTYPNSGYLAKVIFSLGIIGLGLLSIPVLSGSASYAVSEAFKWNEGLNLKLKKAHGFYGVITIATLIGLMINFIGIDPIKALVITAVINGVVAVPLIFIVGKIASSKKIMGEYTSGWLSNILVWFTFIGMLLSAIGLVVTLIPW